MTTLAQTVAEQAIRLEAVPYYFSMMGHGLELDIDSIDRYVAGLLYHHAQLGGSETYQAYQALRGRFPLDYVELRNLMREADRNRRFRFGEPRDESVPDSQYVFELWLHAQAIDPTNQLLQTFQSWMERLEQIQNTHPSEENAAKLDELLALLEECLTQDAQNEKDNNPLPRISGPFYRKILEKEYRVLLLLTKTLKKTEMVRLIIEAGQIIQKQNQYAYPDYWSYIAYLSHLRTTTITNEELMWLWLHVHMLDRSNSSWAHPYLSDPFHSLRSAQSHIAFLVARYTRDPLSIHPQAEAWDLRNNERVKIGDIVQKAWVSLNFLHTGCDTAENKMDIWLYEKLDAASKTRIEQIIAIFRAEERKLREKLIELYPYSI